MVLEILTSKAEVRAWSREHRACGKRIGFVPTMVGVEEWPPVRSPQNPQACKPSSPSSISRAHLPGLSSGATDLLSTAPSNSSLLHALHLVTGSSGAAMVLPCLQGYLHDGHISLVKAAL